jgi:hypothetical protein
MPDHLTGGIVDGGGYREQQREANSHARKAHPPSHPATHHILLLSFTSGVDFYFNLKHVADIRCSGRVRKYCLLASRSFQALADCESE